MEFQNIQLAILIISIFLPPYLIFSSSIIKDGLKAQLFHGLKNYLIFPVPANRHHTHGKRLTYGFLRTLRSGYRKNRIDTASMRL